MKRTLRARVAAVCGVAALAAGMTVALSGVASADSASDPNRATFHDQANATTCSDVGLGDDTQVGAQGNGSASDSNVSGVVKTNAGPIHTGQGEELDVTILGTNVVIDAVVTKGGNGYNVYEDPDFLPPTLQPDQHYIAPFNNGGQVPAMSHWFVCYHASEGPTEGSLTVTKTTLPPTSGAVVPTSFEVLVSCDSGDHTVTVAVGSPQTITGLPDGDVCTVQETALLPLNTVVTYTPPEANTTGVTIAAGQTVDVGIENDFTDVAGEQVVTPPVEPVTPAAAVAAAPVFTG
jgi:Domain of unknown function (DUF5979)